MKVYALRETGYGSSDTIGFFTNREEAQSFLNVLAGRKPNCNYVINEEHVWETAQDFELHIFGIKVRTL